MEVTTETKALRYKHLPPATTRREFCCRVCGATLGASPSPATTLSRHLQGSRYCREASPLPSERRGDYYVDFVRMLQFGLSVDDRPNLWHLAIRETLRIERGPMAYGIKGLTPCGEEMTFREFQTRGRAERWLAERLNGDSCTS